MVSKKKKKIKLTKLIVEPCKLLFVSDAHGHYFVGTSVYGKDALCSLCLGICIVSQNRSCLAVYILPQLTCQFLMDNLDLSHLKYE